jgi:hypothetical protein
MQANDREMMCIRPSHHAAINAEIGGERRGFDVDHFGLFAPVSQANSKTQGTR